MEKKYKLLKDLPDAKAGEIFTLDTSLFHHMYVSQTVFADGCRAIWPPSIVENTPDWFAEIVEPKFPKGIVTFEGEAYSHKSSFLLMYGYNDWVDFNMNQKRAITRVQNSSGEVFSVGDEVVSPNNCDPFIVEDFIVEGNGIWAAHHQKRWRYDIDLLIKKPSAPKTFTKAEIEQIIEKVKWESLINVAELKNALGI